MSHRLNRLASYYLEKPLLISAQGYSEVMEVLGPRIDASLLSKTIGSLALTAEQLFADGDRSTSSHTETDGVAVLNISGPLTDAPTMFDAMCGEDGGTNYQGLVQQAREAVANPAVTSAVLMVNSGGGEAAHMMESAMTIKKLFNDSGKKLIAYVDGTSASAAYGLSVIADEIIANPDARVGSVGVVVHIQNNSEQKKKAGIEDVYVFAGDSKIPFKKDGKFTDTFIADMQTYVDALYATFTQHIADNRNLSVDSVVGTQAKFFDATKALELGLVDKVMTRDEFDEYLTSVSSPNKLETNMGLFNKGTPQETLEVMSDTPDMSIQMVDMQAQLATLVEAKDAAEAALATNVATAKTASLTNQASAYSFLEDTDAVVSMADAMADSAPLFSALDSAQAAVDAAQAKTVVATVAVEAASQEDAAADKAVEDNADMVEQVAAAPDEAAIAMTDSLDSKVDANMAELAESMKKPSLR